MVFIVSVTVKRPTTTVKQFDKSPDADLKTGWSRLIGYQLIRSHVQHTHCEGSTPQNLDFHIREKQVLGATGDCVQQQVMSQGN